MAAFHHLHHAAANQFGGRQPVDAFAPELDGAFGNLSPLGAEDVGDGFDGGGFAGTVGAHQSNDSAFGHIQRNAFEHEDDVIVNHLDVFYAEDDVVVGGHDKTARKRMARTGHSLRFSGSLSNQQSRGVMAFSVA